MNSKDKAVTKRSKESDLEVGRRIRMRRKVLYISQGVLAEALGITFQQIQKYEKGTNRVGAGRLLQIAKFLNVEVSFFSRKNPPERTLQVDHPTR